MQAGFISNTSLGKWTGVAAVGEMGRERNREKGRQLEGHRASPAISFRFDRDLSKGAVLLTTVILSGALMLPSIKIFFRDLFHTSVIWKL